MTGTHSSSISIALLDDDRASGRATVAALARLGYQAAIFDSTQPLAKHLSEHPVKLVLAETNIPGLSQSQFLRTLKTDHPDVLCVVLTSYGSIEGAVEATRLGAVDYVTRPVTDDELRVVIEKALRHQALVAENRTLRGQLDSRFGFESVLGKSEAMTRVFELAQAVADTKSNVLIVGESGTGKSLLARAIHQRSSRRDKPFVELSCGALPETLLESELFGHVKGAFTGAVSDKPGRFVAADAGTLFLDEINSAPIAMQVKLLRVLQEKVLEPVGSDKTRAVDVRCVLATNVELEPLVAEHKFRQDLYYRVNVLTIRVPPLRQRGSDIPQLVDRFIRKACEQTGKQIVGISDAAMGLLVRYHWPGNVRELENAIERAAIVARRPTLGEEDLPDALRELNTSSASMTIAPSSAVIESSNLKLAPMPLALALEQPERAIILAALDRHGWSRQKASAELEIDRTTLYKKMVKYGLLGREVA
jgi:DNA-binding NtrC family response regulator